MPYKKILWLECGELTERKTRQETTAALQVRNDKTNKEERRNRTELGDWLLEDAER